MTASYFVEIRLGGDIKARLRDIIHDIADRFDEHTLVRSHYVPHITLYGPFRTEQENVVLARLRDICAQYDFVPYRLSGFEHFDHDTVYADVQSSHALRQLRYELSQALWPVTHDEQEWDHNRWCQFHSTVARNVGEKFSDIWEYVTAEYDLEYEGYVERVTLIRNGDIVKEYSIPQARFLSPSAATAKPAWERDETLIERYRKTGDHEALVPSQPGTLEKWRTILSDISPISQSVLRRNAEFEGREPQTFVSGDLHLNHANIIDYCDRPFETVREMNQQLVANWNDTVGPRDTVVFLGDLAFYYGTITTHDWLHALNGELVFIRGNHDDARSIDYEDDYILETATRRYYCTHRPENIPAEWDGWAIHGHKHNNDTERYPLINPDEQRVNIAPEFIEYTPLSVAELETAIESA
jgi:calcineurin-like phosphoesterase family protein/2'-5' RNA ligase